MLQQAALEIDFSRIQVEALVLVTTEALCLHHQTVFTLTVRVCPVLPAAPYHRQTGIGKILKRLK